MFDSFSHIIITLKSWVAVARHNFKWVKIQIIQLDGNRVIWTLAHRHVLAEAESLECHISWALEPWSSWYVVITSDLLCTTGVCPFWYLQISDTYSILCTITVLSFWCWQIYAVSHSQGYMSFYTTVVPSAWCLQIARLRLPPWLICAVTITNSYLGDSRIWIKGGACVWELHPKNW